MEGRIFFLSLRLVCFQVDEDLAECTFQVRQLTWTFRSLEVDVFYSEDGRFCPNDLALKVILIVNSECVFGSFFLNLSGALDRAVLEAAMFA